MKNFLSVILTILLVNSWSQVLAFDPPSEESKAISLEELQVEQLTNPVGIDLPQPRLSWKINAETRNTQQTSYHVLVATSPDKLTPGEADLWNSGKVNSDQSVQVRYEGKTLQSNTPCYWKVKVWTNQGETEWSEVKYWKQGLLYYKDWWGRWIGFDRTFPGESEEKFPTLGARYFRTEFELDKEIESATAYIIGLGLYEFHLNGQKVGDAVLAPAPTDYVENVKYNAFDVTEMLQSKGDNAIGVALGNGRYFTMRPHYKPYKIKNYGFPKMVFHMEIKFKDGSRKVVYSSDDWKGTADGPIRNNNEYDGEFYDARKEFPGWTKPGFDDSNWLQAEYVQEPRGDFEAQLNENMKVMQEIQPVDITQLDQNRYILDMGQNMVGWIQMKVKGQEGDTVKLRFAESLEEDGELFMANLRDAKVTDTYILKGEGEESWEPKFTYHGFRYVEVSNYPGTPTMDDFVGKMVYDNIQTVGKFLTSNATINQIYQNAWWGIAGNYKGMPVDCPQRNERQPWLGDRAVGAHGENFIFDNSRLYTKWLEDIRRGQKADGCLPDVAPAYWRYYSDNMTWPGTLLMIADMLYLQTGDVKVLEDNYPAMKKWLEYMRDRYMNENYIVTKDSYGDWVVPPPSIEAGTGQNADVKRPSELISTAYYFHFMNMMAKFAKIIGEDQDIPAYLELRDKVGKAFEEEFYNEEGYYGKGKMTDNILPLYFGMVSQEKEQEVFDHIVHTIEVENDGHLSTGLIGTQWLMRTLTKFGRADLAFQLATNRTYPSWGYMLENGATTIWELWHGNVAKASMNSQNHTMLLGDLNLWFYENLAGIQADPKAPGFKQFILDPTFVEDLDHVNASFDSQYGTIGSHWEKRRKSISWEVTVPPNTQAKVKFPVEQLSDIEWDNKVLGELKGIGGLETDPSGKVSVTLGSGSYRFSFPYIQ
ncbi:glycoside hydrolase family 78 protein [Echinicola jeungdonensis]|uniref:alpha-L-rhamnosidase n=1 Tax=Echinicola jeungdonensis TaxID=709343 RepID=A0ABV5J5G3_9BACT|nr:glycoside hydrolase family 78 protein [Echinicola jeungdonensis]MDN3669369.1 glycoside hydrolase family 78 protein [Echinicola jeungdonensis]